MEYRGVEGTNTCTNDKKEENQQSSVKQEEREEKP